MYWWHWLAHYIVYGLCLLCCCEGNRPQQVGMGLTPTNSTTVFKILSFYQSTSINSNWINVFRLGLKLQYLNLVIFNSYLSKVRFLGYFSDCLHPSTRIRCVFEMYTSKAQDFEVYIQVSFHHILVEDVIVCQCLPFSSIFCCPLLASRLFQEGEESFPTMPLRVYLQKEIVFGLFTPLDIYNQNRKLFPKTLYSVTDQWWFAWIQWIYHTIDILVCACDYCMYQEVSITQCVSAH